MASESQLKPIIVFIVIEPRLGHAPPNGPAPLGDVEKTARQVLKVDPLNDLAQSRLAHALYNLGRYKNAETHDRKLHTLYPGDVDMAAGPAWALLKQKKTPEANTIFRQILLIAPKHPSALEGYGLAHKGKSARPTSHTRTCCSASYRPMKG